MKNNILNHFSFRQNGKTFSISFILFNVKWKSYSDFNQNTISMDHNIGYFTLILKCVIKMCMSESKLEQKKPLNI